MPLVGSTVVHLDYLPVSPIPGPAAPSPMEPGTAIPAGADTAPIGTALAALSWCAGLSVDADGSPRAYAPPPRRGLDFIGNAHVNPRDLSSAFCGVVLDAAGRPVVQGAADPAPGYYVSPTALFDRQRAQGDPRRYVNSEIVPYLAIPPELKTLGAKLGDLAYVAYRGLLSWAIVADIGPRKKIGEGSIALADALRIPASPRNGGVGNGVACVVFLDSSRGWPRECDEAQATATSLLERWGGAGRLMKLCPP